MARTVTSFNIFVRSTSKIPIMAKDCRPVATIRFVSLLTAIDVSFHGSRVSSLDVTTASFSRPAPTTSIFTLYI